MKRVIKSSFNAGSVYEALSIITSDSIQRRVYAKFMNTVEEHSEAYLQGVLDFAEISNHELSGIEMLWNLIQSEGLAEVRSQCVNTMKRVIRESRKHYFGDEESAKYGDLIAEKLSGKTVSKRSDTAEEPGGLIYEANKLGIDMWDLLRALEGMCYEGRAKALDNSTYMINPPAAESINSSTTYNVDDHSPNAMIAEINAKVKDTDVSFIKLYYKSRYGSGCTCFKRDGNSWSWVNDKGHVMNQGTVNEKNSLNLSDSYVVRQLVYSLRNDSCTKLIVE